MIIMYFIQLFCGRMEESHFELKKEPISAKNCINGYGNVSEIVFVRQSAV